jgi:hypothetical protein
METWKHGDMRHGHGKMRHEDIETWRHGHRDMVKESWTH